MHPPAQPSCYCVARKRVQPASNRPANEASPVREAMAHHMHTEQEILPAGKPRERGPTAQLNDARAPVPF